MIFWELRLVDIIALVIMGGCLLYILSVVTMLLIATIIEKIKSKVRK